MKRFILVLCALFCVASFTGCAKEKEEKTNENTPSVEQGEQEKFDISHISIAYDSVDSFNPYKLNTVSNKNIASLLFDSLVKLDTTFTPGASAAESVTVEGTTVKVKLKSGLKFADGSPITAQDIRYSLDMARGETSPYAYSLKNVDSSNVVDSLTLEIYLRSVDVYFKNLLTFPIIKDGEGLENMPTSSGRYIKDGNQLVKNPYYRESAGKVKTISLVELDQKETILYAIQKNTINMYFSMESNYASGAMPILYNNVNMNRLVYLGINNLNGYMSDSNFKKAINMAIDREAINNYVFSSAGLTANTPFNPDFYDSAEQKKVSILDAAKILDSIGFNKTDAEGWRTGSSGAIELRLLVNNENQSRLDVAEMVKKQLVDIGIKVVIDEQPFDIYMSKLYANDFDMYIAEFGLSDNMDLSPLLSPNNNVGFGTTSGNPLAIEFQKFGLGELTAEEFSNKFEQDPLFLPLLYRNGILVYSKNVDANIVATKQDIFFNIELW